jgi:hypothetical protein
MPGPEKPVLIASINVGNKKAQKGKYRPIAHYQRQSADFADQLAFFPEPTHTVGEAFGQTLEDTT